MTNKTMLLLFCTIIFSSQTMAQQKLVDIFATPTDEYILLQNNIKLLYDANKGDTVSLALSKTISIKVRMNMNVWNNEQTHTIGGKLLDYKDAYISLTSVTSDGEFNVTGGIFSKTERSMFKILLEDDGRVYCRKMMKEQFAGE
jgi:hypothetical protein